MTESILPKINSPADVKALPENARAYLERLQSLVNVPIDMISTGPERDETIVLRHPFGG